MVKRLEQLLKQLSRLSSVAINSMPSAHKSVWVVLRNEFPDTPVAGVFTNRQEANAYADELVANNPHCIADIGEYLSLIHI